MSSYYQDIKYGVIYSRLQTVFIEERIDSKISSRCGEKAVCSFSSIKSKLDLLELSNGTQRKMFFCILEVFLKTNIDGMRSTPINHPVLLGVKMDKREMTDVLSSVVGREAFCRFDTDWPLLMTLKQLLAIIWIRGVTVVEALSHKRVKWGISWEDNNGLLYWF